MSPSTFKDLQTDLGDHVRWLLNSVPVNDLWRRRELCIYLKDLFFSVDAFSFVIILIANA